MIKRIMTVWPQIISMTVLSFQLGCTTPSKEESKTAPSGTAALSLEDFQDRARESADDSDVTIEYVLGRDKYHYLIVSKEAHAKGKLMINKQLLGEGIVEQGKYAKYLQKVVTFVHQNPKTNDPSANACRKPFKITIRLGTEVKVTQGCRTSDQGKLSRLIKDGEFLLYSKK